MTLDVKIGNAPANNPTFYGNMIVNGDLTVSGTIKGNGLSIGEASTTDVTFDIGSTTAGSSSTTYIDFHSSGADNDYDARISSSSGTSGTNGKGALFYTANSHNFTGDVVVPNINVTNVVSTTSVMSIYTSMGPNYGIDFASDGSISLLNNSKNAFNTNTSGSYCFSDFPLQLLKTTYSSLPSSNVVQGCQAFCTDKAHSLNSSGPKGIPVFYNGSAWVDSVGGTPV